MRAQLPAKIIIAVLAFFGPQQARPQSSAVSNEVGTIGINDDRPTQEKIDQLNEMQNSAGQMLEKGTEQSVGGTLTVTNINECARKCQPIKNCVGFTYNAAQRDGHSCALFGPTPVKREDVPGWISGERPVQ